LKTWKDINREVYKIPAELIQARRFTLRFEIHILINTTLNEKEFPQQWKNILFHPFKKKIIK
jgi:hypothetical protein